MIPWHVCFVSCFGVPRIISTGSRAETNANDSRADVGTKAIIKLIEPRKPIAQATAALGVARSRSRVQHPTSFPSRSSPASHHDVERKESRWFVCSERTGRYAPCRRHPRHQVPSPAQHGSKRERLEGRAFLGVFGGGVSECGRVGRENVTEDSDRCWTALTSHGQQESHRLTRKWNTFASWKCIGVGSEFQAMHAKSPPKALSLRRGLCGSHDWLGGRRICGAAGEDSWEWRLKQQRNAPGRLRVGLWTWGRHFHSYHLGNVEEDVLYQNECSLSNL